MLPVAALISNSIFLGFVAGIPLIGFIRKVKVYDTFIEGGKEGFEVAVKIIPYLVALVVAVGMFRASGALDLLEQVIAPVTRALGIPPEIMPLALIRPFSGSASNGILVEMIHQYGGNSLISHTAATIIGSTETTFYVLAVYFGVAAITRTRHAIIVGLFADAVGVVASVWICRWLLA